MRASSPAPTLASPPALSVTEVGLDRVVASAQIIGVSGPPEPGAWRGGPVDVVGPGGAVALPGNRLRGGLFALTAAHGADRVAIDLSFARSATGTRANTDVVTRRQARDRLSALAEGVERAAGLVLDLPGARLRRAEAFRDVSLPFGLHLILGGLQLLRPRMVFVENAASSFYYGSRERVLAIYSKAAQLGRPHGSGAGDLVRFEVRALTPRASRAVFGAPTLGRLLDGLDGVADAFRRRTAAALGFRDGPLLAGGDALPASAPLRELLPLRKGLQRALAAVGARALAEAHTPAGAEGMLREAGASANQVTRFRHLAREAALGGDDGDRLRAVLNLVLN